MTKGALVPGIARVSARPAFRKTKTRSGIKSVSRKKGSQRVPGPINLRLRALGLFPPPRPAPAQRAPGWTRRAHLSCPRPLRPAPETGTGSSPLRPRVPRARPRRSSSPRPRPAPLPAAGPPERERGPRPRPEPADRKQVSRGPGSRCWDRPGSPAGPFSLFDK